MNIQRTPSKRFVLDADNKKLETPVFIAAISSVKTNYSPEEHLSFMLPLEYPAILISAYDIFHAENPSKIKKTISEAHKSKTFFVIDSGKYEAFWHRDKNWTIKNLGKAIDNLESDVFFSFDLEWNGEKDYTARTAENTAHTMSFQSIGETAPIIHGPPEKISKYVEEVVKMTGSQIVAVAERDLGETLFERARTIKKIRETLDGTGQDVVLHVLGTGTPRSLLLYSLCGANTFDGLEWCKTIADPESGFLHHFTHGELMRIDKKIESQKVPYHLKAIASNLLFLNKFMTEVRTCIDKGEQSKLIERYFPAHAIKEIKKVIGR